MALKTTGQSLLASVVRVSPSPCFFTLWPLVTNVLFVQIIGNSDRFIPEYLGNSDISSLLV